MKNSLLFFGAMLFAVMMACNNSALTPPVTNTNPESNKYSGTYSGQFQESDNGVDSNGVFKKDTSYAYSLKVDETGANKIVIYHGPVALPAVIVDTTGHFSFIDYNHNINGYFVNDSMYLSSKALNGSYNYPQWFVIQKLTFGGSRIH